MAVRSEFVLTPLQERIKDDKPELLKKIIEEFSCEKDPDVEWFVWNVQTPYPDGYFKMFKTLPEMQ